MPKSKKTSPPSSATIDKVDRGRFKNFNDPEIKALFNGIHTQIAELAQSIGKGPAEDVKYHDDKFATVYQLYIELRPIVDEIERQEQF